MSNVFQLNSEARQSLLLSSELAVRLQTNLDIEC